MTFQIVNNYGTLGSKLVQKKLKNQIPNNQDTVVVALPIVITVDS